MWKIILARENHTDNNKYWWKQLNIVKQHTHDKERNNNLMDANEYRKSNIITILSNLIMDHFGMRVPQDRVSIVITCEKDSWKKEQMNIIFFFIWLCNARPIETFGNSVFVWAWTDTRAWTHNQSINTNDHSKNVTDSAK